MVRIPNAVLMRAHQFLLDVHSAGDATILRRLIPDGIARLIGCDRASFNEMDIAAGRKEIVPTPIPSWWPRFGQVYREHLLDHPLWNPKWVPQLNRVLDIGDARFSASWQKSALFQEYFVPLGVKHQISALVAHRSSSFIGIAANRSRRPFSDGDRKLLELVAPHITQAWKNASLLARAKSDSASMFSAGEPTSLSTEAGAIAVDAERGTMRALSRGAANLLRDCFGQECDSGGRLPDDLRQWLSAQRGRLTDAGCIGDSMSEDLVIRRPNRSLVARVVRVEAHESVIALETRANESLPTPVTPRAVTPREREILGWLREGKRNQEIAVILGISVRTVGKHIEHILQKLGVETRTAAVRMAFEESRA